MYSMKILSRIRLVAVALLFAGTRLLHGQSAPSAYTFTNSADHNWFNPTNWTPAGGPPGPSDTAIITNYTVTLTNAATVGTLDLSGGTLNASTNGLIIELGGNWTGGVLTGLVSFYADGADPAFTLNNPGGTLDLPGATFVNYGTVVWNAGTIRGNNSTVIDNYGTWLAQVVNDGLNNAYGGTPTFNNNGYLEVESTNGAVTFSQVALNNYGYGGVAAAYEGGTVDVGSGALHLGGGGVFTGAFVAESGAGVVLSSGSFLAGDGYSFAGPGSNSFTGGTLVLSNDYNPALSLQGGTVTLGPGFQNSGAISNLTLSGSILAGTNTLTGALNWQAGAVSGALTISPTGLLDLSGSVQVVQYASLTNSGQILWNGAGDWEVYNDGGANNGLINNLSGGVIAVQCNNNITGYGSPWISNAGAFTKPMSAGTTSVGGEFTNTGTVSVRSGALTGTVSVRSGALVFGNGSFGGVFQTGNGTS
jgi:hypothetical protein